MPDNVLLVGYRGTGKTTVARLAALKLGWDWLDLDVELELRAGKSIAAIFAEAGEGAFRDLETEVLRALSGRTRLVIATGGGVVLRPENRKLLRQLGRIVWLRATPETILERVAADPATAGRRPNLTTSGGREEVVRLLAIREPIYSELAELTLDTDALPPDSLAEQVARFAR